MKIITNELIQKYKECLYEKEKATATIEKYIHNVIAFMTWLCEREITKSVVMEYIGMNKDAIKTA